MLLLKHDPLAQPLTLVELRDAGAGALGSVYGFLQGAWPFGIVDAIWATVAARRWWFKTRV